MTEMYTIKHQDKEVNAKGLQLSISIKKLIDGLIRETETKYQSERVLNAK